MPKRTKNQLMLFQSHLLTLPNFTPVLSCPQGFWLTQGADHSSGATSGKGHEQLRASLLRGQMLDVYKEMSPAGQHSLWNSTNYGEIDNATTSNVYICILAFTLSAHPTPCLLSLWHPHSTHSIILSFFPALSFPSFCHRFTLQLARAIILTPLIITIMYYT